MTDNSTISFLNTIGEAPRHTQIVCFVKPNENNMRPVKLFMRKEEEKVGIMPRLYNLKNTEDVYRRLSVRDDYTIDERDMIREWVKKAER